MLIGWFTPLFCGLSITQDDSGFAVNRESTKETVPLKITDVELCWSSTVPGTLILERDVPVTFFEYHFIVSPPLYWNGRGNHKGLFINTTRVSWENMSWVNWPFNLGYWVWNHQNGFALHWSSFIHSLMCMTDFTSFLKQCFCIFMCDVPFCLNLHCHIFYPHTHTHTQ